MLWGRVQCVIRNHLTATQNRNSPWAPSVHTETEARQKLTKGKAAERREKQWKRVRGVKKVLLICDLLEITRWALRVSEGEGGRGVRPFSARQGTAHARLTPIYMLFLLPLFTILKVCQSQSLRLFHMSLTSISVCVWKGNLQAFFSCTDCCASYPNRTAECLWEAQCFCPICFVLHAAPEV